MSTEKAAYGSLSAAVGDWIANVPAGQEIYYGDAAADLDLPLPTVAAILLKLCRKDNPVISRGTRQGWYRKRASAPPVPPEGSRAAPINGTVVVRPAPEQKGTLIPGDLMEVVGSLKNGNIIVRATDGALWEATQL